MYEKMQRISEGYLADLGIDVNEKDEKVRLGKACLTLPSPKG